MIGSMLRSRSLRASVPLLALLTGGCAALAAACTGGGGAAPASTATPEPAVTTATPAGTATPTPSPTATPTSESYAFPTGPAALVAADYEPPEDRVASTGAYLPSNGKPTLVFGDAIW